MGLYSSLLHRIGGKRWFAATASRTAHLADRGLRRLTGGRLIFTPRSLPTLFLTTTGCSTGKRRTSPLLFLRDGADLAVVGTNWGGEGHPGWSGNLLAEPEAEVTIGRESIRVRSRLAAPEEFTALWPRFVEMWEHYDTYRDRSGRHPRMFLLTPL